MCGVRSCISVQKQNHYKSVRFCFYSMEWKTGFLLKQYLIMNLKPRCLMAVDEDS